MDNDVLFYKKVGAFTIIVFFVWSVIIGLSIVSVLPLNPITQKYVDQKVFNIILPQSWGFFSKNPREEIYYVFNMNTMESAVNWPNNLPKNLFGLDRSGRAQGTEMGLIMMGLSDSAWAECDEESLLCLSNIDPDKSVDINNLTPLPTICGDVGLVKQKHIPWAWSQSQRTIIMPSQVARVNVECSVK